MIEDIITAAEKGGKKVKKYFGDIYIAGKIIAREAGALITDFMGNHQNDKQTTQFIASNTPEIQKYLISILKALLPKV